MSPQVNARCPNCGGGFKAPTGVVLHLSQTDNGIQIEVVSSLDPDKRRTLHECSRRVIRTSDLMQQVLADLGMDDVLSDAKERVRFAISTVIETLPLIAASLQVLAENSLAMVRLQEQAADRAVRMNSTLIGMVANAFNNMAAHAPSDCGQPDCVWCNPPSEHDRPSMSMTEEEIDSMLRHMAAAEAAEEPTTTEETDV